MLGPVEISPSKRGKLRRGVRLGCEITTNSHGPKREMLIDLSADGARVLTDVPMERGEDILIGFAPERLGCRVETIARVAHVERSPEPAVGLEFIELEPELQEVIEERLRHIPPPLPRARSCEFVQLEEL
jgi:hypothetical protein